MINYFYNNKQYHSKKIVPMRETPDSKSGKQISICETNVFKAPPTGTIIHITESNNNVINIDAYSMNLLI